MMSGQITIIHMRFIEKLFERYGRFVARNPLPFLLVPVACTLLSTLGLFNFRSQDDIWDIYAPLDALSRVEEHALERFEAISGANHYRIQVVVDRKDGGNLMNAHDMAQIDTLNQFVADNLSVPAGGRLWSYRDICGAYCNESNVFIIGLVQATLDPRGVPLRLELTYPNANAFHSRVFIGYSIGGLSMDMNERGRNVIRQFRLFILHYMINMRLPRAQQIRDEFEESLLELFERASATSPNISYALLSRNRELVEQRRITTTSIPYLFITGLLLTVFMVVTLIDRPLYRSQCIEAVFGIVSPAMALVTTLGLIWAMDQPFSNILTVVPFLVITIGIDDAFLILAGWRHSTATDNLEARIGESVARSGASVAVTSVTDVMCFGVGVVSNMPVVRLFCLYTSVALTIDFIYQMTFFLAVTVYCGRRQMRLIDKERVKQFQLEQEFNFNSSKIASTEVAQVVAHSVLKDVLPSTNSGEFLEPIEAAISQKSNTTPISHLKNVADEIFGVEFFVDVLSTPVVRALIFAALGAHLVLSLYFCTLVSTDFDMENLYMRDSPLTPVSRKMQRFVLGESFVVNFALVGLGDAFASSQMRAIFASMIAELEQIPHFGPGDRRATTLWLRDYDAAVNFWMSEDESNVWDPAEMLRNYRAFRFDEKFIQTRMNEKGEEIIDSFAWFIVYRNMHNFIDVQVLMDARRDILRRYAALFTVYSHHNLEKVPTESAKSAPANFVQTGISAVVLMSVLVFLCILDVEAIFCVVLSILSISLGTVGYLHVWNVNLDAVSLISMLMSIGFSVDYSAHVCYHFYTHGLVTKKRKSKKARRVMSPIPSIGASDAGTTTGTTIVDAYSNCTNDSSQTPATIGLGTPESSSPSSSSSCSCASCSSMCAADVGCAIHGGCESSSERCDTFATRHRLVDTLNAVGWPVLQSGASTVLGMIPLFFVGAYVVDVFWKTIILVTALGMIHALVVLPVLFVTVADLRQRVARGIGPWGRRVLPRDKSPQKSPIAAITTTTKQDSRSIIIGKDRIGPMGIPAPSGSFGPIMGPIKLHVND